MHRNSGLCSVTVKALVCIELRVGPLDLWDPMLCICLLYGGYASVSMCLRKVVKIHLYSKCRTHCLLFGKKQTFVSF